MDSDSAGNKHVNIYSDSEEVGKKLKLLHTTAVGLKSFSRSNKPVSADHLERHRRSGRGDHRVKGDGDLTCSEETPVPGIEAAAAS